MTATSFTHETVLLDETVEALQIGEASSGGVWVDGTFGRGGHARLALSRMKPNDRLVVFDKDPEAIDVARELASRDSRVTVVHAGFASMQACLNELGIAQVQGVMLDIGVSSPQIDNPERGFSFMRDGPLDMRMDSTQGVTVAQWLEQASQDEIKEVVQKYGEERFAFQIAKAIKARLASQPITTTGELAQLVASVVRTREKGQHPATRTFQALRIYINQELTQLAYGLSAALTCLAPKGRLAVISFHSLEDRLVKQFIQACAKPGQNIDRYAPIREVDRPQPILESIARIKPPEQEVLRNPRSRSAVLRVAQRTEHGFPDEGVESWLERIDSFQWLFNAPLSHKSSSSTSRRRR